MCGVIAIIDHRSVANDLYEGLLVLQHRGQDAAGIVTCSGRQLFQRKANGWVRDVFRQEHMDRLKGNWGIGHVRYPTAGGYSEAEVQPLYVNSPYGIALAHNGNLTNAGELIDSLFETDRRHINSESDSEALLNVLAHELFAALSGELFPTPTTIFSAVEKLHRRCRGAYAVVALLAGLGLLIFRDPLGIRPLTYGVKESKDGISYMFASESVAITSLGYEIVRDVAPGEAIFIDARSMELYSYTTRPRMQQHSCIFEYVYFARPDSILDEVFVHRARMKMGEFLAAKIKREWPDYQIDVVVPVPDTSRTAAVECAVNLGVKYREGFIKNRYIGRTFIMPGNSNRKLSVARKLNPLPSEFSGKTVLLVDDSIVRGTTSKQIIQMVRNSGARQVYFVSASPPVLYPNVYGVDIPSSEELVAHGRSTDGVRDFIGADRIFYQDYLSLKKSIQSINPKLKHFEGSIFTGEYVV